MARMLLAGGRSFTEADADVFEGLSPAEIQAYVAENTQVPRTFVLGCRTSGVAFANFFAQSFWWWQDRLHCLIRWSTARTESCSST